MRFANSHDDNNYCCVWRSTCVLYTHTRTHTHTHTKVAGVAKSESVRQLYYGLGGPGFNFLFFSMPRPAVGPTQPPIQWVKALFPTDKAAGAWGNFSPPSTAEVKMSGATPLLPLYAFLAQTEDILRWCIRDMFTLLMQQSLVLAVADMLSSFVEHRPSQLH